MVCKHVSVVFIDDRIKIYVRKIPFRKIPVQSGLGRQLNTSSFEKKNNLCDPV